MLYLDVVYIEPRTSSESSAPQLVELLQGFDPVLQRLVEKAGPAALQARQNLDREESAWWVNGKLALLGDAAHPFTSREYLPPYS